MTLMTARRRCALLLMAAMFMVTTFLTESADAGLSAARRPHAPAALYIGKARLSSILNGNSRDGTVLWEKTEFKKAAWNRVPAVAATDLQPSFELARDEKPLTDDQNRARRATWLYPDDGCFFRATIAADYFRKVLAVKPAKIFAFGGLSVSTPNSPDGSVTWWYHVATIAKVVDATSKAETYYVYDPAISANQPMNVKDWLRAMNAPDAEIAICSGDAYDPDSQCENGQADTYGRAQSEASTYLMNEWSRLEELGRDPAKELGDSPPWLRKRNP